MKNKTDNILLGILAGLFGVAGLFLGSQVSVLVAILFMQYANGRS